MTNASEDVMERGPLWTACRDVRRVYPLWKSVWISLKTPESKFIHCGCFPCDLLVFALCTIVALSVMVYIYCKERLL